MHCFGMFTKTMKLKIEVVNQGYFNLIREYRDAYKSNSVTDNLAEELTERYLDLESKKVSIKKIYASKFKKALSPKKNCSTVSN